MGWTIRRLALMNLWKVKVHIYRLSFNTSVFPEDMMMMMMMMMVMMMMMMIMMMISRPLWRQEEHSYHPLAAILVCMTFDLTSSVTPSPPTLTLCPPPPQSYEAPATPPDLAHSQSSKTNPPLPPHDLWDPTTPLSAQEHRVLGQPNFLFKETNGMTTLFTVPFLGFLSKVWISGHKN